MDFINGILTLLTKLITIGDGVKKHPVRSLSLFCIVIWTIVPFYFIYTLNQVNLRLGNTEGDVKLLVQTLVKKQTFKMKSDKGDLKPSDIAVSNIFCNYSQHKYTKACGDYKILIPKYIMRFGLSEKEGVNKKRYPNKPHVTPINKEINLNKKGR